MTYRINEFQFQLPAGELQDATINILKFPELGTSLIISRSFLTVSARRIWHRVAR